MAAVTQFTCLSCGTTLKSPKPLSEGTKIKCPKCGAAFAVGGKRRTSGVSAPAQPQRRSGGDFKFDDTPGRTSQLRKRRKLTSAFIVWPVCFFVTALFVIPPYIVARVMLGGALSLAKEQDLTDKTPDFTMTAADYAKETRNRETTREKYSGKVFQLDGVVKSYDRDILTGTPSISLVGTDMEPVRCRTIDKEPWASVSPGQQVTIKGRTNFLSYPGLIDCIIVKKGDNPAIEITAEQLTQEYAAGVDATNQKYENKYLILTGEVAEQKPSPAPTHADLYFKGSGTVRVKCMIDSHKGGLNALGADPKDANSLAPPDMTGKQVTLIGKYGLQLDNKQVELSDCELITKKK
jgi:hypothetical protein